MARFLSVFCITTVIIFVFVLGISSCEGRTPIVRPVPIDISLNLASTRLNSIIDLQAENGKGGFGEGDALRIGSGNTKIEDIKSIELGEGTLILTPDQPSSITQQASELEADFEMWIAAGEFDHVDNPSAIVVEGSPDLTWTANAKRVADNIYEFSQAIENFQEATDNALNPVINGNYTAFVELTLKDSNGLLNENFSISLQNLHLNVVASELPNDVTLIRPFASDSQGGIIAFEATPKIINKGEKAILRWWISETFPPLELTIDNSIINVFDLIQIEVSPEQTTTYALTLPTTPVCCTEKVTVTVVP